MSAEHVSWRPLKDWERRIIERLLSVPFPGRDALLDQLKQAVASTLVNEKGIPLDDGGSLLIKTTSCMRACVKARVPVEGKLLDVDGIVIHYLLFVGDDGMMYMLDIFKEDSSKVLQHAKPDDLEVTVNG